VSTDAAALDPHLLRAAELDDLEQISDEAARHALAHYAARQLRAADRLPSSAIVQAMERCLSAQRQAAEA
jgi:hypothetical protein